jgi:methylenetetrahydrofolate reductase (NADPH)
MKDEQSFVPKNSNNCRRLSSTNKSWEYMHDVMHVDNKADFCIGVAGYPRNIRITIAIIRFKRLKAKLTQALIMW